VAPFGLAGVAHARVTAPDQLGDAAVDRWSRAEVAGQEAHLALLQQWADLGGDPRTRAFAVWSSPRLVESGLRV
jgi:hypothetical protein